MHVLHCMLVLHGLYIFLSSLNCPSIYTLPPKPRVPHPGVHAQTFYQCTCHRAGLRYCHPADDLRYCHPADLRYCQPHNCATASPAPAAPHPSYCMPHTRNPTPELLHVPHPHTPPLLPFPQVTLIEVNTSPALFRAGQYLTDLLPRVGAWGGGLLPGRGGEQLPLQYRLCVCACAGGGGGGAALRRPVLPTRQPRHAAKPSHRLPAATATQLC